MQDLLAGRIDYMCPTITTAMAQLQSHQVQAPAVLGSERSPAFPDIADRSGAGPQGLRRQQLERDLPAQGHAAAPIVAKLNAAVLAAMAYASRCSSACANSARACRRRSIARRNTCSSFVESEIKTWGAAIKAAGITPE